MSIDILEDGKVEVWENGQKIKGVVSVNFTAKLGEPPVIEIAKIIK